MALVVLLAAAVAALAVLALVRGGEGNERQAAAMDEVTAAWNQADGDAFAALFAKNGVLTQYLLSEYHASPLDTRDETRSRRGPSLHETR